MPDSLSILTGNGASKGTNATVSIVRMMLEWVNHMISKNNHPSITIVRKLSKKLKSNNDHKKNVIMKHFIFKSPSLTVDMKKK